MPDRSLNECVEDFSTAIDSLGAADSPCDDSLRALFRWHAKKLPPDNWADFTSLVVLEYLEVPASRDLRGDDKKKLVKQVIWRVAKRLARQVARNSRFVTGEPEQAAKDSPDRARDSVIQALRAAGRQMTATEWSVFAALLRGKSHGDIRKELGVAERTFYRVLQRVREVVQEVLRSQE